MLLSGLAHRPSPLCASHLLLNSAILWMCARSFPPFSPAALSQPHREKALIQLFTGLDFLQQKAPLSAYLSSFYKAGLWVLWLRKKKSASDNSRSWSCSPPLQRREAGCLQDSSKLAAFSFLFFSRGDVSADVLLFHQLCACVSALSLINTSAL